MGRQVQKKYNHKMGRGRRKSGGLFGSLFKKGRRKKLFGIF